MSEVRPPTGPSGRTVLVLGATGYVGGRLVPLLLDEGHTVRVLVRSPARAHRYGWSDRVELHHGDVLDPTTLGPAFEGCDAAYHLVHAMGSGDSFEEAEARGAAHVRDAAAAAELSRLVYLGGMGGPTRGGDEGAGELSAHLASRQQVGRILAEGPTPTTELRAAVIIGSGSLSFEMLRYLTEVLPVMVTPSWVRTRCQPIAVRDVLHYLVRALDDPEPVDRILEIAGPDVVTYQEMMQAFAEVAGLPRRIIVPVPMLSPRLSSRWVGLVTPLPTSIARPLIDSLRHEVVQRDRAIDQLIPHRPIGLRAALELALRRTRAEAVDTRWSDAGFTPADTIPGDPEWAGGALYTDHQVVPTTADEHALYEAFARIGGANGYYVANGAWWLRGLADKLIGGPGLRRGRRHPVDLRAGESLDFWRVVRVDVGRQLVLQAEMKVPGKAWLTWRIDGGGDDGDHDHDHDHDGDHDGGGRPSQLHQVAFFAPKGLFGRAYWFAMWPFHRVIFGRMARAIVARAERQPR